LSSSRTIASPLASAVVVSTSSEQSERSSSRAAAAQTTTTPTTREAWITGRSPNPRPLTTAELQRLLVYGKLGFIA
jgi:hypothetical protein